MLRRGANEARSRQELAWPPRRHTFLLTSRVER